MENAEGPAGMNRGYVKRKLFLAAAERSMRGTVYEMIRRAVYRSAVFCAVVFCMAALAGSLTGCVSTEKETGKIRDMKCEVTAEEDVPPTLREMIDKGEKKPFRITYSDQGIIYIAQGYGVQPTTGYSVEVKELYETETAVCIKTTLVGPKKGEETEKKNSYPYVVVQTEDIKKDVLFE